MSSAVFVSAGDTNAGSGFVETTNVETIGSDDVTFTAFSGTASIIAGAGLSKSSTTIDVELTALSGLTFSATGDAGTLEVALKSNAGLYKVGGEIAVDYDDVTIRIDGNQRLGVKDNSIKLEQMGVRFQADEFSGAGDTLFTLANAISSTNFRNGGNVQSLPQWSAFASGF